MKRKTNSTIFLLPALGIDPRDLEDCGFIDSYIRIEGKEYDKERRFLVAVFEPVTKDQKETFDVFLEREKFLSFVEEEIKQGDKVIVVYRFPEEFYNDYDLIIEGKYSKVSDKYKGIFPKFREKKDKIVLSLQKLIFDKDPDFKEQQEERIGTDIEADSELWEVFDIDKEILKLDI